MITFEIFEETGPIVSGRGSVTEVTNMNWKRVQDVSAPYYFNPLRRPTDAALQTLSYKKYIFFKVSGTYSKVKDIKLTMTPVEASQSTGSQLFYKFTNVYEEPNDLYDGKMIKADDSATIVWHPNTSPTSPILATSRAACLTNEVFYTGYIVTQMRVPSGSYLNNGNTTGFEFKLSLNEFE